MKSSEVIYRFKINLIDSIISDAYNFKGNVSHDIWLIVDPIRLASLIDEILGLELEPIKMPVYWDTWPRKICEVNLDFV